MKSAFEVQPGGVFQGEWVVPGDKSISHRALILASIAKGTSYIEGFLYSEDCLATLKALQQCGIKMYVQTDRIRVEGQGLMGLQPSASSIDCQNSGTSIRLLAGLLSAQNFDSHLMGDESLIKRPMKRIFDPLSQMGAELEGKNIQGEIYAPLLIRGKKKLKGIEYTLPIASAQVKSCLLLAGLCAKVPITIVEKETTRDHTERMLTLFGANIVRKDNTICLNPVEELKEQTIQIPGDFSSAAFFIASASFTPGSHILIRQVGINETRTGLIKILRAMGAKIQLHSYDTLSGEPVADIEVMGGDLQGIEIPSEWVVLAIDEFPIIFVAAAVARGTTTIKGIRELRFKETDRITTMANALKILGIQLQTWEDGILIEGGVLSGGQVDAKGDHRIAMALAMAGMKAKERIKIDDVENVSTSFPGFIELAKKSGLTIVKSHDE